MDESLNNLRARYDQLQADMTRFRTTLNGGIPYPEQLQARVNTLHDEVTKVLVSQDL